MKNFVVGYLSFFDNELILEKIEAESDYEAIKKAMLNIVSEEYRQDEIDFQNSEEYPKKMSDLRDYFFNGDSVINVIEL